MGITRQPSGGSLQPTKPYMARLREADASANTYYTVVDVTSGMGKIYFVGVFDKDGSSYSAASHYRIKLTLDGVETILTPRTTETGTEYDNELLGRYITSNNTSNTNLAWEGELCFYTSAKVEILSTTASTIDYLCGAVKYALVA